MHDEPGPRIPIMPGEYRVSKTPVVFTTLLGSCVAACLYDAQARVAGMNHFLLPVQRVPENRPLGADQMGRYGIDAMELLINSMLKIGASRARLRAKIFGGASLLVPHGDVPVQAIGASNIRFIHEFLKVEAIPVESEDLGGSLGRVIRFHTDSYEVWRRYIKNSALEAKVSAEEADAWRKQVAQRGHEGDVTLFS